MGNYGTKIFTILKDMNHPTLTYQQSGLLLDILNQLNLLHWKRPAELRDEHFKLSKPTLVKERKFLMDNGWITFVGGKHLYSLGKNFLPDGIGKGFLPEQAQELVKVSYQDGKGFLPTTEPKAFDTKPFETLKIQNPKSSLKTEKVISGRLTDLDIACVNAETAADDSFIVSREGSPSRSGDESEAAAPDPIHDPVIKDLKPAFGSMDPDSDEFDDAVCTAYSSSPEPITAQSVPPATETPQSQFAPGSYDWMEEQKALSFQRTLREYIAFCHPDDLVLVYPEYKDKFDALVALGAPVQPKRAADMTLGDAWDSVAAVYPTVKFELNDKDREYYKFAGENWDQLSQRKRVNVLLALKRKRQNGCTPYGAVNDEFDPNGLQQELWRAKSGKIRNDDFSEDPFASDRSNTTADMFA